jgi:hypothetical protein
MLGSPVCGLGDETGVSQDLHPWGRFHDHNGAWKRCRVTTETLDENGSIVNTSVTETKTTLEGVDAEGVTLRVEAITEIAGKRLPSEPKRVRQCFRGDSAGGKAVVKSTGTGQVTIEGRTLPCRIEETELLSPGTKTVTRIYYSRLIAPYILKRESKTTDAEGKTTLEENTLKVISLDRACKILPRVKRAAWIEAASTGAKGSTVTRAFTSIEVPGGVIWHSAEELDPKGRLVRRSSMILVDYGLDPDDDNSPAQGRGRSRQRRNHRGG